MTSHCLAARVSLVAGFKPQSVISKAFSTVSSTNSSTYGPYKEVKYSKVLLKNEKGQPLYASEENNAYVGILTLNRPSRLNSLSPKMGEEILDLTRQLGEDKDVRAVVLTGEGRAFSTGRDLKISKSLHTAEEKEEYMDLAFDTAHAWNGLKVPTIAAVNGFAFGWGLEMALASDLRVFALNSMSCLPECSLGIFPGAGGMVWLRDIVPLSVAKDLVYTSRTFDGKEALRLNIASRVTRTGDGTLEEACMLAHEIGRNGPLGVRNAKKVFNTMGNSMTRQEAIDYFRPIRSELNYTEDFEEALMAFEEKRDPIFKGK
eukprot:Nk52_evm1s1943 gene=Nk52_evmTU1s1943